jgi:hypothetical protein
MWTSASLASPVPACCRTASRNAASSTWEEAATTSRRPELTQDSLPSRFVRKPHAQRRSFADLFDPPESGDHVWEADGSSRQPGRRHASEAGHALEDRNCEQLYEMAKKKEIHGRSKMGKWELIDAIRAAR